MSAVRLLLALVQKNVQVWVEDGELCLRGPKGALSAEEREQLVAAKPDILELLQPGMKYRLSSAAQQRLWFLDQLEPGGTAYNLLNGVRLRGRLDVAALERGLNEVVRRHETLRTHFQALDGQPVQVIAPELKLELPLVDLSGLPEAQREAAALKRAGDEAWRAFDLSTGPLVRCTLLRLSEMEHILLLDMHHIISDGWSMGIFFREIVLASQGHPLAELPMQYADFALWQREWLQGAELERQVGYWRAQLGGELATLELPTDHPRPALLGYEGGQVTVQFPAELTAGLQALSRTQGVTLFMTLLAAFDVLLARYSRQTEIVVGSPIANRNRGEIEGLIGFFVNSLVLRVDLSGDPTFEELLSRVKGVTLGAYEHQDLPFEKLVDELQAPRDMSRNPLFQVMFVLQNAPLDVPELSELHMEALEVEGGASPFDLTLSLQEVGACLRGTLEYNSALYERETVERMLGHYRMLLESILAQPGGRVLELELLTEAERRRLLVEWNAPQGEYLREAGIHELFEAQVERTPDAVAVIHEGQPLTYRELDERSGQLANFLQKRGVGPDVLVGVCLERSVEMVVALLGVLKAGGAYVPLDPGYPRDRLAYMVTDSHAAMVLTQKCMLGSLPTEIVQTICLDDEWESLIAVEASINPLSRVEPANLAYLIYTSGSTGKPKGVCCAHAGVVNLLRDFQQRQPISSGARCSFWTSFGFDVSVYEIFSALVHGGTLMIAPEDVRPDAHAFIDWLFAHEIHSAYIPPFMLETLLEHLERAPALFALRRLLVGVEPIRESLLSAIHQHLPGLLIVNGYGPTEATICASLYPFTLAANGERNTPIGRPVQNTQLYVLDAHLWPVPIGWPGELYIGGAGLARGYLNAPELTAGKFIPDPFGAEPGARLYRTGDLVRWLRDGNLEFLGRIDQQVKLRGFRIELGEIESALGQQPGVCEAVVVAREDQPGDKRLVAYLVPDGKTELQFDALRTALKAHLPDYMLPSAFVPLEKLPLTPNGKIDRKALPAPEHDQRLVIQDYIAPQTPTEAAVAEIWARVLGLERVGIQDNFFDLGGHSLLATQALSRIRESLGVDLPLRALFQTHTVAELAQAVDAAQHNATTSLTVLPRPEQIPLSYAQQRLWFLDQLEPGGTAYNLLNGVRLRGRLDVAALERGLNEVVRRHETLRTHFQALDGQPVQVIAPELKLELPLVDLSDLPEAQREAAALKRAGDEAWRAFDLSTGPLVRCTLLRLSETEHILLLDMHHIISDGWSMGIFFREIVLASQGHPLAELPMQYADFALWQREWLQGAELERQVGYWRAQLGGELATLELPTDHPRPALLGYEGGQVTVQFPAELTAGLQALSRTQGVTLFMTLLAAFDVLLARYSRQTEIVVGSPIANRNRGEIEGLIGFFVNSLVLRVDLSGDPTFEELLSRVKGVTLGAYEHQDLPFEKLVDELQAPRDMSRNPLFQVMFVLQNAPLDVPELSELHMEALEVEGGASPFDLTLSLREVGACLRGTLEYNSALYERETVERMLGHYRMLLESILAQPGGRVLELELLTDAERRRLLVEWNAPQGEYLREAGIHELFEAQVERTPDVVAVIHEGQSLTYRALNERANQVGHALRKRGVGLDDEGVGICVERSLEMVVGLLGILKAGGAYVPLDPGYPQERLGFMIRDSGIRLILTQEALVESLRGQGVETICLDQPESFSAQRATNLARPISPENLAYIIYTSGSTGKPKGVQISHRAVVNFLTSMRRAPGLTPADRLLSVTTLSFDIAGLELYLPLTVGAQVEVVPREIAMDGFRLGERIRKSGATVMQATPATWRLLLEADWEGAQGLKVLCGGEALPAALANALRSRSDSLWNMYGPTETTIWSMLARLETSGAGNSPIGRPILNTQVYLLDARLNPVPIGVAGELYIGGDGLARGYFERPGLTAERFIPDPFSAQPGARLYRTGDLARWLPDGNVGFIGRIDQQVKLRGFRIELGEIENVLGQQPGVCEAVVVAREDRAGDKRLVAYLVPDEEIELQPDVLRSALKAHLPDYMLPSAFVLLGKLPLTPNGKVDRKALPAPEHDQQASTQGYIAPRTSTEATLAEIWARVLGLEQVGIQDNFFALGGDSLLGMRVIAQAHRANLKLTPRQMLQFQTIAELAEVALSFSARQADDELVTGPVPLAPNQHWFFDQNFAMPHYFNLSTLFEVRQPLRLEPALVEQTMRMLLLHHDALRARFVHDGQTWRQFIAPPDDQIPVSSVDLSQLPWHKQEREVERISSEAESTLDLSNGPLLRVILFDLGPRRSGYMMVIIHHLATDGYSNNILMEDFMTVYQHLSLGEPVQLPTKTTSFKQWNERLVEYARSPEIQQELDYWRVRPGEVLPGLPPLDCPDGKLVFDAAYQVFGSLDVRRSRIVLDQLVKAYDVQLIELMLAVMAETIGRAKGDRSLYVDILRQGREMPLEGMDLSRTVGWTVIHRPLLLRLGGVASLDDALPVVRDEFRRPLHGGVGYDLLRYMSGDAAIVAALPPRPAIAFSHESIQAAPENDSLVRPSGKRIRDNVDLQIAWPYPLELRTWIENNQLFWVWTSGEGVYRRATVEKLSKNFGAVLQALCRNIS